MAVPRTPMFDAFKKLRLASAFLGHTPEPQGSVAFSLRDVLGDLSAKQLEEFGGDLEGVFAQPGVTQLFENHYLPRPESLDVLLDLPRETLGYHYGVYLKRHRVVIEAPPPDYDPQDRVAYVRERVRMNHALLHVVTEYDASPTGELALQAFFVGQLGNLASGTIVAAGLLQILQKDPSAVGETLAVLAEAYERGRAARNFLGTPWEEFWYAPIAQVRELTGIPPRTSTVAALDIDRVIAEAATMGGGRASTPPPAPEPEPEPPPPPRSSSRKSTSGAFSSAEPTPYEPPRRPRRRWAGLDLLSQSSAEPDPPPAPEPTRLRLDTPSEPAPETTRLRLDTPSSSASTTSSSAEPTRLRLDSPSSTTSSSAEPTRLRLDTPSSTTSSSSEPTRLRLDSPSSTTSSSSEPTRLRLDTPAPSSTSSTTSSSSEPTRLRLDADAPTLRRRDAEGTRVRHQDSESSSLESAETLFDPPAPPPPPPTPPSARSLFAKKEPSRSPHEAPTVDSKPLDLSPPSPPPPDGATAEPADGRRREKPRRGKEEGGGYKEIDSVDEDLPNPGDRDYF